MNDSQCMGNTLTGQYCFTSNFWGSLILWVEISTQDLRSGTPINETYTYWRKARVYDLPKLNIKKL